MPSTRRSQRVIKIISRGEIGTCRNGIRVSPKIITSDMKIGKKNRKFQNTGSRKKLAKFSNKTVRISRKIGKSEAKFTDQIKKEVLKFGCVVRKFENTELICIPEYPEVQIKIRNKTGKHPYTCQKCDMGFWTKKAYEAHAPVHILRKAKPPVKKFRCDVCSKEFSKLCDVERHTRVHTGEKPCICNICNKRFQQAHNLSKHLLTHLHLKPFVCEICNKQFGRSDVLRRHLLTHSVDKPVKCSICSRGFIRHSQLLQHHNKKHPDQMIAELAENAEKEMNGGFKNE